MNHNRSWAKDAGRGRSRGPPWSLRSAWTAGPAATSSCKATACSASVGFSKTERIDRCNPHADWTRLTNCVASSESPPSSKKSSSAPTRSSRKISHQTFQAAYTRFTPNNSEQRLHPLYYRGCWHRVSRCFFFRYSQITDYEAVSFRPGRKCFTIRRPSSHTRRCCVRLSPIAQYSQLLPPVGVWTVSQFQCG